MKQIRNFLVRALCAIGVGVMLILYRNQAITWLTIACGSLFFISGLISCAFYLGQRSRQGSEPMYDVDGNPLKESRPPFPLVGIGSIVLGIILVFMRESFEQWGIYVLSVMLILGALNQYMVLARARKYCTIGMFYWIVATAILLIGLLIIAKPELLGEWNLKVIGWSMLVYGAVEIIIGVNAYRARRRFEKEAEARRLELERQAEQEAKEAEEAEAEEVVEPETEPDRNEGIEEAVVVETPEEPSSNTISFSDEV